MIERSVQHDTFTIERALKASPEQVFHAWANPEVKRRWFPEGPGWEVTEYEADFRVGGRETSDFRQSNGPLYRNDTVYLDIVPSQRIVFAYTMASDGERISASLASVEIRPDGEASKLTFTEQAAFLDGRDKPEYREAGWGSLLDALDASLSSALSLQIDRMIKAPRALVWKVWNSPEHAKHWGPDGFRVELQGDELREGAPWRACLRSTDGGKDLWQGGVFREVREPERLVYTFAWERDDGSREDESLIVLTLYEFGDQTKLTLRQFGFPSSESRDGHEEGWGQAVDAMIRYVSTLDSPEG